MVKKTSKNILNLSYTSLIRISLLGVLLCFISNSYGQFKVYPVERKAEQPVKKTSAKKQSIPLSLPFWDDFSFTPIDDPDNPNSNFPLDSIWSSTAVWVHNGGINMPSQNVVTFDGLRGTGESYSDVVLEQGICDSLVSNAIDLSVVTAGERSTVWLSFFYQWKGQGEPPDKNDFIRLQFLDDAGNWETKLEIYPKASFNPTVFYDTIIQVAGDKFFHTGFKFRFDNRGRKTGSYDTWNLDYIYLNKGRTISSRSFADRNIASGLNPIFGSYYAMPQRHFDVEELDSLQFNVQSRSSRDFDEVGYKLNMNVTNYFNGNPVEYLLNEAGNLSVTESYQRFVVKAIKLPRAADINPFESNADSVIVNYEVFIGGDEEDIDKDIFAPINFKINDTVSQVYTLRDYYAYDDGTAEYSGGTSSGKFLYAFDMLTEDTDTLVGFYAYFPPASLNVTRQVTFYVHLDNGGVPEELPEYVLPLTVVKKGINEFQFIEIKDQLITVKDRFYIGYESLYVKVGLDNSHETGDRLFYSAGGNVWVPNDVNVGSLMIRPKFGPAPVDNVTSIPEEELDQVMLYPNPNNGVFTLTHQTQVKSVMDITGRAVAFLTEPIDDTTTRITIQQNTPGVYILQLSKGQTLFIRKVVIHH